MYSSQKQGLHLNTLFLACGASIIIIHPISVNHSRIGDPSDSRSLTSELQDVFSSHNLLCAYNSLSCLLCLSVAFLLDSELESDLGLTSHYLLLIMSCTKIC